MQLWRFPQGKKEVGPAAACQEYREIEKDHSHRAAHLAKPYIQGVYEARCMRYQRL